MDGQPLTVIFDRAASHARNLVASLSSSNLLQLYGLYKQATVGANRPPRPSWFEISEKSKWDAWASHGNKTTAQAMTEYIALVVTLDPEWIDSLDSEPTSIGAWVHHSSLAGEKEKIQDDEKTLFDWTRENDAAQLRKAAQQGAKIAEMADADGLRLLHWAADRGHIESLRCLLELGATADVADSEGQTPLHYAASCGHEDIVRELLSAGANRNLADAEGMTPLDVASSPEISKMLVL